MRLLHTHELRLQEFPETKLPRYAILSHTWGDQEVSYSQLNDLIKAQVPPQNAEGQTTRTTSGFAKIDSCRAKASDEGFEWVWIDCCCIDKSSSAELSEAINSMYSWYRQAGICYAYLFDVPASAPTSSDDLAPAEETQRCFRSSRWFTRGWTLQELLAPSEVIFLDSSWKEFGIKTRHEATTMNFYDLTKLVSDITGVPCNILRSGDINGASIAQRMSWASRRETTREEDLSYCLLGIFDVNMPLLYGEGSKAFIRLQEELMKVSNDPSIFAWYNGVTHKLSVASVQDWPAPDDVRDGFRKDMLHSFFAASPYAFAHSARIVRTKDSYDGHFENTNRGIRLDLPLCHVEGRIIALLGCQFENDYHSQIGIFVNDRAGKAYLTIVDATRRAIHGRKPLDRQRPVMPQVAEVGRSSVESLAMVAFVRGLDTIPATPATLFCKSGAPRLQGSKVPRGTRRPLMLDPEVAYGYQITSYRPEAAWDTQQHLMYESCSYGAAVFTASESDGLPFTVLIHRIHDADLIYYRVLEGAHGPLDLSNDPVSQMQMQEQGVMQMQERGGSPTQWSITKLTFGKAAFSRLRHAKRMGQKLHILAVVVGGHGSGKRLAQLR